MDKQNLPDLVDTQRLTHVGALKALHMALAHADSLKVPVTVSVCDASGVLLAMCRMDGAFFLTVESSLNKAATAAATATPTGDLPDTVAVKLGIATYGRQTGGLKGGVPIIVGGRVVGAVGAGSGTGEQDREISLAGVRAIAGAKTDFSFA
ncbi:MAG: heme-binding protein [Caldimonas sp.]